MPKLTDDQLGDLLRETFADHVDDQASLPIATKRRPLAPVLIAAAAVLAVLAGTVSTVHRTDSQPPTAPTATATPATNDEVWATAIRKIAKQHEPAGGWRTLRIYPMVWRVEGRNGIPVKMGEPMPPPAKRQVMMGELPDRDRVARMLGDLAPVEWSNEIAVRCPGDVAEITIGPMMHYPTHKSVRVDITYGCTKSDSLLVDVN
jgi:hypothetical protein